ncbi:MAG: alpha-amylase family glycosyl hydrolase [Sumerlaeia bacterium]
MKTQSSPQRLFAVSLLAGAAALPMACDAQSRPATMPVSPQTRPATGPVWAPSQVPIPLQPLTIVSGESGTVDFLHAAPRPAIGFRGLRLSGDLGGVRLASGQSPAALRVHSDESANGQGLLIADLQLEGGGTYEVAVPLTVSPMPKVEVTYSHKGKAPDSVSIAGPFNGWTPGRDTLTDSDGDSTYTATLSLPAGDYPYKFVVDGNWIMDPDNPNTISEGGYANSKLTVAPLGDGEAPKEPLEIAMLPANAPGVGPQGGFRVSLTTPSRLESSHMLLLVNNAPVDDGFQVNPVTGVVRLDVPKDKWGPEQFVTLVAVTNDGRRGSITRPFDFSHAPRAPKDDILYYVVVDRFRNADPENDAPVQDPNLKHQGNFKGGDFAGVTQALNEGYFDRLGITSLWLSPVNKQPDGAWQDAMPPKEHFTGYHGYWPTRNQETDPRFGTLEELKETVATAHSQSRAVLLDFVSNHVHQEHPMLETNPDWIVPLELPDGSKNIRQFDAHPFTTWFDTFLPSLNYPDHPDLVEKMTDVGVWWLQETGADGFRHDAVKHVPLVFWERLTEKLITEIAKPQNKRLYQVGESIASRGTINEFVGPELLDGQFDFPLFWPTREAFSRETGGLDSVGEALLASQREYPLAATMSPLIGNHDFPRFMGYADKDVPFDDQKAKFLAFSEDAPQVDDPQSYEKIKLAFAYLMTIPGMPLVYYGDEIGLTGAHDPDNRRMMIPEADWNAYQSATFEHVAAWAKARHDSVALRRGWLVPLHMDAERLVYARVAPEEVVVVSLARKPDSGDLTVQLPKAWGEPSRFESLALLNATAKDVALRKGSLVIKDQPYSASAWVLSW